MLIDWQYKLNSSVLVGLIKGNFLVHSGKDSVPAFRMENKMPQKELEAKARVKFPSDDVQSVKLPPMSMSPASAMSRNLNNTLNIKNEGKFCDIFLKFAPGRTCTKVMFSFDKTFYGILTF